MPALAHEAVDWTWTVVRGLESAPVGDQLHDLLIASAGIRHIAKGHHLPEKNTERPEIRPFVFQKIK